MAIYALGEIEPTIHPEAFVHPDATVIGNVTLAAGVSAALRDGHDVHPLDLGIAVVQVRAIGIARPPPAHRHWRTVHAEQQEDPQGRPKLLWMQHRVVAAAVTAGVLLLHLTFQVGNVGVAIVDRAQRDHLPNASQPVGPSSAGHSTPPTRTPEPDATVPIFTHPSGSACAPGKVATKA